jgi:hypothetical protein
MLPVLGTIGLALRQVAQHNLYSLLPPRSMDHIGIALPASVG